jgi:hypothetical protein
MCVAGCDRCLVLTDGVSTHAHRRNKGCAESCMTKPHSLRQPMFPHLSQCSTLCSRMFDLYAAALQAAPCLLHALSSCLHNCDVICLGSHRRLSGLPGSIVVCTHRLMRRKKNAEKEKNGRHPLRHPPSMLHLSRTRSCSSSRNHPRSRRPTKR